MDSTPLHPSHLKSSEASLSWTSSKIPIKQSRPLPKPKSKPLQKENLEATPPRSDSQVRLADLCPEDKARIGELVKRVALEKSQREETESKFDQEKRAKEKRIRKIAKENAKLLEEKQELIAKNEKLLEILESCKQNSGLQSSWREWEKPPSESPILQLNSSTHSLNITSEPQKMMSMPISPIRDTNNASVQTLSEKEVQAFEENFHQRTDSGSNPRKDYRDLPRADSGNFFARIENREPPKSKVVNEIENLKNDIFTLSESVKCIKASSLRASQNLVKRKDLDSYGRSNDPIGPEDEKLRRLIERSEASNKRAKNLEKEVNSRNIYESEVHSSDSDFRGSTEKERIKGFIGASKNLKPVVEEKHEFAVKLEKNNKTREKPEIVTIDQGFYDDALFDLVDDLEKSEENQDIFDFPSTSRFEKDKDFSSSCSSISNNSSKIEKSVDSFQELRIRALRLKETLKY